MQVNAQLLLPVPAVSGAYVDSSYTGTNPPSRANTSMTLTSTQTANGTEYTATPASGFYGVQVLEVTGQSATPASWDSSAGVNPVYTAFVPVYVNPPAPQIASISSNGQTVTGTASGNNSSADTTLSFDVTGAVSGGHGFGLYGLCLRRRNTPIATGTVAANSTTVTLTTTAGSPTISAGSHEFTVRTDACHLGSRYLRRLDRRSPAANRRGSSIRFRPVPSAARFRQPPHSRSSRPAASPDTPISTPRTRASSRPATQASQA